MDRGKAHDQTALVVLERAATELHVRHIERLPLGTSYPNPVERMAALVSSPQMARDVQVAVDSTGVGRARGHRPAPGGSENLLHASDGHHDHGGSNASRAGSRWSVPKRDLIAAAQVAIQTKRLKIASALPTAQFLADELAAFRVKVSEDGKDTFRNGREPANDDLVLTLAIAVYTATRQQRRSRITHVGLEPPVEAGCGLVPDAVIPHDIFR